MERRTFLTLSAGLGLSALLDITPAQAAAKRLAPHRPRICVLGGGILGASIALHCARAGAAVTLLEKTAPAAGATSKSFAWINPFVDDAHYMALRLESIARWRKLDRALGLGAIWGGYVAFSNLPGDRGRLATQARELAAAGHPMRTLDRAELKKISPEVVPGTLVEDATYSALGGHLDPVHATRRLLAAATRIGVRVLYPCAALAIEPAAAATGPVAIVTPQGRKEFDHVIVVTGVDAPALLAPLGYRLPLQYSPGALVYTKPMPIMTRHAYDGPTLLEWKQMADGSVVGLETSTPPHIPVHEQSILKGPADFPPGIAQMHGARILSKIGSFVPAIGKAEYAHMTLGLRPMPTDNLPIVGAVPGVPGVSLCVTHSGVTLAAVLGAYMANEVVGGTTEPMLARYRPTRAFPEPQAL